MKVVKELEKSRGPGKTMGTVSCGEISPKEKRGDSKSRR